MMIHTKRNLLTWLVAACVVMSGFGEAANNNQKVDYFADNGFSNAVKPMQHPAGEYHKGVTYVAYQGPLEDPYVAAYHHQTGRWTGPFKAGISAMGKDPDRKVDNHGKPAMIIDDAGYIHLVFGGHGGMDHHGENLLGNTHYGEMKHVVTKKPLDISAWEELDNIPPFGTYNQWVKMDNGDIYLFYRHGAHKSNWVYQKSSDNGSSFDPPVSILKTKPRTDVAASDSWYAWFTKGQDNQIIATYNYHLCTRENHFGERYNGYYMEMDTTDHTWRNVQGRKLTMPVTKEDSDKLTLVSDTGEYWANRGTTALDPEGNPHVIMYVSTHLKEDEPGPQQVRYHRWNGKHWTDEKCPELPVAVGDMMIPESNKVRLILAERDNEKNGTIAWWDSENGGKSFHKGKTILELKKTGWGITSFIRNAHPDARVMVMARQSSNEFGEMYLLGDNGPVKRLKSEADVLND